MIEGFLILNPKGTILLSRSFKDQVTKAAGESFKIQLVSGKIQLNPINEINGLFFCHIQVDDIYFVAVCDGDFDAAIVFSSLHSFSSTLLDYLSESKITQDQIQREQILIQELLDESFDYGYPQLTQPDELKLLITHKGYKRSMTKREQIQITIQATGAIAHRRPGISYSSNDIFVAIIEKVNLLMSSTGSILRSDVIGDVKVKCHLSGMPECKFALTERILDSRSDGFYSKSSPDSTKIALDDVQFHQCVKLSDVKKSSSQAISFVPPDGVFQLMHYRTSLGVTLPFMVTPIIAVESKTKIEIKLTIRSLFPGISTAENVTIFIPVPKTTANVFLDGTAGKAKYEPGKAAIVWRIRQFPGMNAYSLRSTIHLVPSSCTMAGVKSDLASHSGPDYSKKYIKSPSSQSIDFIDGWERRPPITMTFRVPYFTCTGLRVKYLEVYERSDYTANKFVKYESVAGSYQIRF
ncbi:AP-2 complex subunit mu [Aduncisulcus paluster]|uniref:AP-2 complex subunit mu n=1 Tax=Aduncisulcus paluster TaxID=2918883 RepID=A0ABQ5KGC8_9EUKA|nr:AP-2 complex subunit mu [Aduncisulcus paluster]